MNDQLLIKISFPLLLLFYLFTSCTEKVKTTEVLKKPGWEDLIDKNLSIWDSYLSYQHKDGYEGDMPLDEEGNELAPIGLNPEGY